MTAASPRTRALANRAFVRRLLALKSPGLAAAIRITAEHGPRCPRCGKLTLTARR